ncbi:MAG: hypothetical protein JWM41_2178 [Gemmatimonadetes bacterium]|nr:hypothetical protein [Gemmatimonadota bacterium]
MPNTLPCPTVDPDRLRRAAARVVTRVGANRFLVEGRHEPHYLVDLDEPASCRCRDAQVRGGPCLHELAARLHVGDGDLVLILGRLLADADREIRTMRARRQRTA